MNHTGRYLLTVQGSVKTATFAGVADAVQFVRDVRSGDERYACSDNSEHMNRRAKRTDEYVDDVEWCEGMTSEQCFSAMTSPTESKRALMDRFEERLAISLPLVAQPRRRLVKRLDDGDTIDAERYAAGTVEGIWARRKRISVMRPTISVGINTSASSTTSSADTARSAASVLALVKQCEDAGYAVTLDWLMSQRMSKRLDAQHIAFVVPLKAVGGSCDWSTLVGMCVGSSTMRTLGFDLISALSPCDHGTCYGYPRDVTEGYDLLAPGAMKTDAEAREWVEGALRTLGVQA